MRGAGNDVIRRSSGADFTWIEPSFPANTERDESSGFRVGKKPREGSGFESDCSF